MKQTYLLWLLVAVLLVLTAPSTILAEESEGEDDPWLSQPGNCREPNIATPEMASAACQLYCSRRRSHFGFLVALFSS